MAKTTVRALIPLIVAGICMHVNLWADDLSFTGDKSLVDISGTNPVMWVGANSAVANPLAKVTFGTDLTPSYFPASAMDVSSYVTQLALLGGTYPVFTLAEVPTKVYCLSDVTNKTVIEGTTLFATGVDSVGISAIAANDYYIFCAVHNCGSGKKWGELTVDGAVRGIAILEKGESGLTQVEILESNGVATPDTTKAKKAARIDLAARGTDLEGSSDGKKVVAFYASADAKHIATAEIGDDVTLYWDSKVSKLYIGLSDVRRDDYNRAGGVCSLLVGSFDSDTGLFTINPIVSGIGKDLLYGTLLANKNTLNFIHSFYFDGVDNGALDVAVSTKKICGLTTSTNKHYLLVNCVSTLSAGYVGGAVTPQVLDGIYALPVTSEGYLAKVTDVKEDVYDKQVADFSGVPTAIGEMPRTDNSAVVVGGTINMADDTYVKDIWTYGDTVYVSRAGFLGCDAGMFKSTALLNAGGVIFGWTPWQRVSLGTTRTIGGGVDIKTGNIFGVRSGSTNPLATTFGPKTPVVSAWDISKGTDSTNLNAVLYTAFKSDGGVRQLFNFDEYTPGFAQGKFSMMVALGKTAVAIVVTGKTERGVFTPVTEFYTEETNQNVFVYKDNDVLTAIAPLYVAEVARSENADSGWLFVGGEKGLACLRYPSSGNGWASQSGLGGVSDDTNPAILFGTNVMTWEQVKTAGTNLLTGIRGLASDVNALDVNALNVITKDSLLEIKMSAENFKSNFGETSEETSETSEETSEESTGLTPLASGTTGYQKLTPTGLTGFSYSDICFVQDRSYPTVLAATTKGLYVLRRSGASTSLTAHQVSSIGSNPVVQLYYLSTEKGSNSSAGNLYALVASTTKNTGKIYRFYVDASVRDITGVVSPIGSYVDLGKFRYNFATDGTFIWDLCPAVPGNKEYVRLYDRVAGKFVDLTSKIGIDLTKYAYVRGIAFNTASGEWVIPGDFGVGENMVASS